MSVTWKLSAFADEAGKTVEEQVTALHAAGIKHVDIRAVNGFNIAVLPAAEAEKVRKVLDAGGITVGMFGSPLGKIDVADDPKVDYDKLRHMASLKDILGCNQVRIFSYYNRKANWAPDKFQAESLKRLKALKDIAGETGLILYHENERHIFGDRLPEVQVLIKELRDGRVFKFIFDFDNYQQSGDDVWANWQALKNMTDAFHLKDSTKENLHVPVGQGNGKVREILADAMKSNWNGWLALEPHLQHSKAVLATGLSGKPNQAYAEMKPQECFQLAADAAVGMLKGLDVEVG